MKLLLTIATCLSLALPVPALAAEMISPRNAIDIAEMIREKGYKAVLKKDSVGDPMISTRASGLNYIILFYSCDDGNNCGSVQLSVAFTLDGNTARPDLNEWNRQKRYAKAYFDQDGDIVLRYDINMWGEGVSRDSFDESLNVWERLLDEFKEYIDW